MGAWLRDLRLAVRGLRRTPRQSLFVIGVLGLALGGNAAMFTLLDALVLRPLPVTGAERLVRFEARDARGRPQLLPVKFLDVLTERQRSLEQIAGYRAGAIYPSVIKGVTGWVSSDAMTGDFYEMLGVKPLHGRLLNRSDLDPSAPSPVVVVNHAYWRREFNSDPGVVGRAVSIDGVSFTIVGVAPDSFRGLSREYQSSFTMPLASTVLSGPVGDPRVGVRVTGAIGRLRTGVTLEAAQSELQGLWRGIQAELLPPGIAGAERDAFLSQTIAVASFTTGFSPLRDRHGSSLRGITWLMAGLLALAAINVGGLFIARAASRQVELAVRVDLGATRRDVARMFLAEAMVWTATATLVAAPLSYVLSDFLVTSLWTGLGRLELSLVPGVRAWGLIGGACVLAIAAIGLMPMVGLGTRRRFALRHARATTPHPNRLVRVLLIGQVAVSLALIFGSTLLVRNLNRWQLADPGFDPDDVTVLQLSELPRGDVGVSQSLYRAELVRALGGLPGVTDVALARGFARSVMNVVLRESAGPDDAATAGEETAVDYVSPGFFSAMRIPIIAGRDFTWQDTADAPLVAIVTADFAARWFPDGAVLGQRIRIDQDRTTVVAEIVGVSAPYRQLDVRIDEPVVLRPAVQAGTWARIPMALIRSRGPFDIEGARRAVSSFGREYVLSAQTAPERTRRFLAGERTSTLVAAIAACLGLLLAAAGVHSLLSWKLSQRRRELAVRSALGASAARMRQIIWGEALAVSAAGLLAGVPIALGVGRLVAAMLTGMSGADATSLVAATILLAVAAASAAVGPMLRAGRTDPIAALRSE